MPYSRFRREEMILRDLLARERTVLSNERTLLAYIRTAIIKGMPRSRVVMRHAVRNALMAPITIIMLHVNWLIGGIVVVEVIFGYPGLGNYIYKAAIFGDYNAVMAAAMVTVLIAVFTRLIGDFAYTLLNPRIRYA